MLIENSFTISQGAALMAVSCIVSLSVFAINSKINATQLKAELAMRDLELKIERDYIKPAFDSLLTMVRHVEEQLRLRDELRTGFEGVHAALQKRRIGDNT